MAGFNGGIFDYADPKYAVSLGDFREPLNWRIAGGRVLPIDIPSAPYKYTMGSRPDVCLQGSAKIF